MNEGVPKKCLECPMLKVQLDRIEHQERTEAEMIMSLMAEDQEMGSVLAVIRNIRESSLKDAVDQMSDEEILREIRARGSMVVEMNQQRTEKLRRDLGAFTTFTFGCAGPLKLRASRGGIQYTATICAAPLHLEENEGPTAEVATIDRKELD